MKTMFKIFILFLVISNSIPVKAQELSLNKILRNKFTQPEISEIQEILSFFDNYLLKKTNSTTVDSAYIKYMEGLKHFDSIEDLHKRLKADKTPIDSFIRIQNEKAFFNKIMIKVYGFDHRTKDTLTVQLNPNLQGEYLKLLNKAIKFDPYFKYYKDGVNIFGGIIPPTCVGGFQYYNNKGDFKNEIIRLIVTLHYFSIISYTELKPIPNRKQNNGTE